MSNGHVLRTHRNENFKTVSCVVLDDRELSFRAKGVHFYLITRPDNWSFSMGQVMSMSTEGSVAFSQAIKELKARGYLKTSKRKGPEGKFIWTWDIYEIPYLDFHSMETHSMDNHGMDAHSMETHPIETGVYNIEDKQVVGNIKEVTSSTKQSSSRIKLPISIKEVIENKLEIPEKPAHVAAIWYWCKQRLGKRNLDFHMTSEWFKETVGKFSSILIKSFHSLDEYKAYIDWYIGSDDEFIVKTNWSIDYLAGQHCYNKYLAEKTKKGNHKVVITDEDRAKVKGRWIK